MNVRTLACRFLSIVTLLALLLSSVPVTAGPVLPAPSPVEGPVPSAVEGSAAEGSVRLVDAPVPLDGDHHVSGDSIADDQARAAEALHSAPLMFIENAGQFDPRARFQVRGADRTLWLAEDALWVTLLEPDTPVEQADILNPSIQNPKSEIENRQAVHLKLSFAGANPHPRLEPFDRLDAHVSYFIGDNPADWRADVPVWGGVRYVDLYAGLDLEITGGDTWLWRIVARAPEADLGAVRLRVDGADGLALDGGVDSAGRRSIRVSTALGEFALPLLERRRGFGGSFQAGSDFTHRELPPYEGHSQPSRGLVPRVTGSEIAAPFAEETPVSSGVNTPARVLDRPQDLLYATFLGGSGSDYGEDIVVDGSGNAYVTGRTESPDFPAASGPGYDTSHNGDIDAFVVKLNPGGTDVDYATFLGGSGLDCGYGITVDGSGSAYVTGNTDSSDFPAASGPGYDTSHNGFQDAFVVKLTPGGTGVDYATFLGGSRGEGGAGIAVDGSGNAYVTGNTSSSDFPAAGGPGYDTTHNGVSDAFVVKLNPGGTGLAYATFLGGSDTDYGYGIAVDGSGYACVTGSTQSSNFPAAGGPGYDTSHNGDDDAFVVKLNPGGTILGYATFLGGSGSDYGEGIAVDGSGNAYVTGNTHSSDFPAASGPGYDTSHNGGWYDVFVVKLNPGGTILGYATFLGGSGSDYGEGIAVDGSGSVYVTGYTGSSDFPAASGPGYDTSYNGSWDAFIVKMNPGGTSVDYATFLGGSSYDYGYGIAVDGFANAHVTGYTDSSDFPAMSGPGYDTSHNGGHDAFAVKLVLAGLAYPTALDFGTTLTELTLSINPENAADAWTLSESIPWLSLSRTGGTGPATITVSVDRTGQPEGPHSGTINATVSGQAVTVNVTMRVVTPDVTIVTPLPGSTFYHSAWMLVKAAVTLEGQPLVGAQVKGRIILDYVDTLPVAVPIAMYDDGDHFDGNADDGIYAGDVVLYGSATMPVSDNPYLLTVIATADSGSGSDSISINLAASDGAPTVAVEVSGPSAPDYFAGQQATVTARLTYPDASVHTGTAVTLTVIAPDLSVTHVGLTNVADDTWSGTYTFSTDQGGLHYLDARADPPDGSGFVDGWDGTKVEVYLDVLTLNVTNPPDTYYRNMAVPLTVCVTAGDPPDAVEGADVNADITPGDGRLLLAHTTNGCYSGDYYPAESGVHQVTFTAQTPAYKSGSANGSFTVSASDPALADAVTEFADGAVGWSEKVMDVSEDVAETGDWFAAKIASDKTRMMIEFGMDAIAIVKSGVDVKDAIDFNKIGLPGACEMGSAEDLLEAFLWHDVIYSISHWASEGMDEVFMSFARAPYRYYATGGSPNTELDSPRDYIEERYTALVPTNQSLQSHFYGPLDSSAAQFQVDIQSRADAVAGNLPFLTAEQEEEYINDLARRQDAHEWLAHYDLFARSDLMFEVKAKREYMEQDEFRKFILFLSEAGLKVGMTRLFGHLGEMASDSLLMAYHAYLNSRNIEQDQHFRDIAIGLMKRAHGAQAFIGSNTLSGLNLVEQATLPQTPGGEIVSTDLVRTTPGFPLGFITRDVYVDLQIENTGDVSADYAIVAYYSVPKGPGSYRQVLRKMTDPTTGEQLSSVTLSPGGQDAIRMYFVENNGDNFGTPKYGVFLVLYALTDRGAYVLDVDSIAPFEPRTETTALAAQIAMVTPASLQAENVTVVLSLGSSISETERYPVWAMVGADTEQFTYTLNIAADNPFPMPLAVVISQTIPSAVSITDPGEGTISGGEITWYRVIQPRETILVEYAFDYSGDYAAEATLPPAHMSFYDAADDVNVTLNTGTISFYARSPLRAQGTASTIVAPGTQQTVPVTVTNLDSGSTQQGGLTLHVWTTTGTEVLSTTTPVSLGAGASQDYDLIYTAPDEGLYVLEVALHYGDETTSVICDLLKVRENRVYLPVVLRN